MARRPACMAVRQPCRASPRPSGRCSPWRLVRSRPAPWRPCTSGLTLRRGCAPSPVLRRRRGAGPSASPGRNAARLRALHGCLAIPRPRLPAMHNRLPGYQKSFASRDGCYRLIGCEACRRGTLRRSTRARPTGHSCSTSTRLPRSRSTRRRCSAGTCRRSWFAGATGCPGEPGRRRCS